MSCVLTDEDIVKALQTVRSSLDNAGAIVNTYVFPPINTGINREELQNALAPGGILDLNLRNLVRSSATTLEPTVGVLFLEQNNPLANDPNRTSRHWVVVLLDLSERALVYFDTLGGGVDYTIVDPLMSRFVQVEQEIQNENSFGMPLSAAAPKGLQVYSYDGQQPLQRGGTECGLISLYFVDRYFQLRFVDDWNDIGAVIDTIAAEILPRTQTSSTSFTQYQQWLQQLFEQYSAPAQLSLMYPAEYGTPDMSVISSPSGQLSSPMGQLTSPSGQLTSPTGLISPPTGSGRFSVSPVDQMMMTTDMLDNSVGLGGWQIGTPTGRTTPPTGYLSTPTGQMTTPTGRMTTPTGRITTPTGQMTTPTTGRITTPTGRMSGSATPALADLFFNNPRFVAYDNNDNNNNNNYDYDGNNHANVLPTQQQQQQQQQPSMQQQPEPFIYALPASAFAAPARLRPDSILRREAEYYQATQQFANRFGRQLVSRLESSLPRADFVRFVEYYNGMSPPWF
jgi:hypothetical protein